MKQYLVVSDIHGQYDKFLKLYKDLKNIKAQFVFLGDVVDRGEKVKECIDLLIKIKNEKSDTILIKGNHEEMLIKTFDLPLNDFELMHWSNVWLYNGGVTTLKSYNIDSSSVRKIRENRQLIQNHFNYFFYKLQLYYMTDSLFFVHAGLDLNKPFSENTEEDFLWIRPPFYHYNNTINKNEFNRKIIHGHTPERTIFYNDERICVDTGSYRNGGKLSAVLIDEKGNLLDVFESI